MRDRRAFLAPALPFDLRFNDRSSALEFEPLPRAAVNVPTVCAHGDQAFPSLVARLLQIFFTVAHATRGETAVSAKSQRRTGAGFSDTAGRGASYRSRLGMQSPFVTWPSSCGRAIGSGNRSLWLPGTEAGPEKNFVGTHVPDTRDHMLVHQGRLHGAPRAQDNFSEVR